MTFDFNIEYAKSNSILHMDALSRLWYYKESNENTGEKFEDTFLHLVDTVLSLGRMVKESMKFPVLSKIKWRVITVGVIVLKLKDIIKR